MCLTLQLELQVEALALSTYWQGLRLTLAPEGRSELLKWNIAHTQSSKECRRSEYGK